MLTPTLKQNLHETKMSTFSNLDYFDNFNTYGQGFSEKKDTKYQSLYNSIGPDLHKTDNQKVIGDTRQLLDDIAFQ